MKKFLLMALLPAGLWFAFAGSEEQMPVRPPVALGPSEICSETWMCREQESVRRDSVIRGELPLRVATYNVHKCTGMDARRDPERIAKVIRSLDADIISLQEVLSDPGEVPSAQVRYLARETGMYAAVSAPTKRKKDGMYGNALLSRFPIRSVRLHNISYGASEPRGIIDADVVVGDLIVRVVSTHLGLLPSERTRQAERLLEILPATFDAPLIVMGDMNGWVPGSPVLRKLTARLGSALSIRSFPSSFPLLPLDRIWVLPAEYLQQTAVHDSPLSRIASDHLPLVSSLYLKGLPYRARTTLTLLPSASGRTLR